MPERPGEEEISKWHKWFGIECNNTAWRLAEQSGRSPHEDEEMLRTAHASVFHWSKVGTELHVARGEMLLGHVHALLGHGDLAMRYAKSASDFVMGRESDDWEVAFAHAVLANAASVAGEKELHSRHYEIARSTAQSLDKEDREIFDATFRTVPIP